MKRRDIILDFTSLLDVTLIIIFFFVLFAHLDSRENKARTDEKVKELEAQTEQAENREAEAEALYAELEKELALLEEADDRQAATAKEQMQFQKSENIKIILSITDSAPWEIRVVKGNSLLLSIEKAGDLEESLKTALKEAGYKKTDTVFCEFLYDGSKVGSETAYRMITKALSEVVREYRYLYVSETDLSLGGEA